MIIEYSFSIIRILLNSSIFIFAIVVVYLLLKANGKYRQNNKIVYFCRSFSEKPLIMKSFIVAAFALGSQKFISGILYFIYNVNNFSEIYGYSIGFYYSILDFMEVPAILVLFLSFFGIIPDRKVKKINNEKEYKILEEIYEPIKSLEFVENIFTYREIGLIKDCFRYTGINGVKGYGLPGHNLMRIIVKLTNVIYKEREENAFNK